MYEHFRAHTLILFLCVHTYVFVNARVHLCELSMYVCVCV